MSQSSKEGIVRIGATIVIPEILKRFRVDPVDVITEAGLDPKVFDDPDNMVSFAARSRLVELSVARTGCQHFGLLAGQQCTPVQFSNQAPKKSEMAAPQIFALYSRKHAAHQCFVYHRNYF